MLANQDLNYRNREISPVHILISPVFPEHKPKKKIDNQIGLHLLFRPVLESLHLKDSLDIVEKGCSHLFQTKLQQF